MAPLQLVAARARRRPGRSFWLVLGITLAVAFGCAVAAEGTIAGDRAAHATLASLSPLDRAVTLTQQGPATAAIDRRARALLTGLGLPAPTSTVLLNPVRLSQTVVRLAAIDPLGAWVTPRPSVRPCRAGACPVLQVGGRVRPRVLRAPGVRVSLAGSGELRSAAALGFVPTPGGQPLLVTGDVAGLEAVPALSSVYRTESWVALAPLARLHSWQLAGFARRLSRTQSELQVDGTLSLSAPIDALDQAQGRAGTAPQRLRPAAGGALAALAVFVVLAAYGLRRDQRDERRRMLAAGARTAQLAVFSLAEAAWLSAVSVVAGAALGIGVAALLASRAGLPAGAVLSHSLLTGQGAAALAGGWLASVAVIGVVLLLDGGAVADVLALAAAAALALALTVGSGASGTLALLVAPLACVAAAGMIYRAVALLLRGGERLARSGPLPVRLALIGLARAPVAPALAVAFVAVSTGLGGFALAYRATLRRGSADEADQAVALDLRVAPSATFQTPLQVAGLARWRSLTGGGHVLAVRRTYASLPLDGNAVTVNALGVPAAGLTLLRGWRESDGSAPLRVLARRLAPTGPVRTPGPRIPAGSRWLTVLARSSTELDLTADLRDPGGMITQVPFGATTARLRRARARVPARGGPFELEALELDEPTGVAALNGHQNGENPAAATQSTTSVRLGTLNAGRTVLVGGWSAWRGVGAVAVRRSDSAGRSVRLAFDDSGQPGVLRPRQPSDTRPVPVLADADTAAGAGPGGALPLTVDGEPVAARVVGVLQRFPTLGAAGSGSGFVVADEATLAGALDASLPGQGRPDELWISTPSPARLRAALRHGALSRLSVSFRADVLSSLRSDPVARSVLGTLVAAAFVTAALAITGLLMSLLGALRDTRAERDLAILGLGPRQLRNELRLRVIVAGTLGTVAGVALGSLLTRLVVGAVRAAGAVSVPDPPLVAVTPWGQLALLALGTVAVLGLAGAVAALGTGRTGRR